MTTSLRTSDSGSTLSHLLDEFAAAQRQGQTPDVEDYARRHPHLAAIIRSVFPAVLTLEADPREAGSFPQASATCDGQLGDFRLIRELGRGGMGVVYEAEEISLGRRVALKLLPFAGLLESRQLERFKNEARAAALLKHPHIVSIYSVGYDRGVHYFAMEYVDGCNLSQWIDADEWSVSVIGTSSSIGSRDDQNKTSSTQATRQPTSRTATPRANQAAVVRLVIQAAAALEHAHRHGVIHRDIKPSNLLVDRNGNVYVSDFGLAHIQSHTGPTVSGDIIGTLRYMSPEQLAGRTVDERTDIYSLGLTLYELVVGQPAFGESSPESLLRQILEVDPIAPRHIHASIPRDLETIILKASSKDREHRYATVSDFRTDLERFLEYRPIQARRMSHSGHFVKWCRRRPAVALLTVALIGLLFLLSMAGPMLAIRYARLADLAQRNLRIADLNRAYESWYSGNVEEAERLVRRHGHRSNSSQATDFALQYLVTQLAENEQRIICWRKGPVQTLAVSPDGNTIASAGNEGLICLTAVQFGQPLRRLNTSVRSVSSLAFSPDGEWLLAGGIGGSLELWDCQSWQCRAIAMPEDCVVYPAAFAPDGRTFAVGSTDGHIAIWSTTGDRQWAKAAHTGLVSGIAFGPQGGVLYTSSAGDGVVKIWDAANGQLIRQLPMTLSCGPFGLVMANDGSALITFGRLGTQFWDPHTATEQIGLRGFTKPISSLAMSSKGLLATGGYDHLIMIWDRSTGFRLTSLPAHRRTVSALDFTSDGQYLISASDDGTVRRFDMTNANLLKERLRKLDLNCPANLDVSPDGRLLVSVAADWEDEDSIRQDGELMVWDCTTGQLSSVLAIARGDGAGVAVMSDGLTAATCGPHGVRLWNLGQRQLIRVLDDEPCHAIDISPDSRWLAVLGSCEEQSRSAIGNLRIWDLTTSRPVVDQRLGAIEPGAGAVTFSDDSRALAVGYGLWSQSAVDVWTMNSGHWQCTTPAMVSYSSTVTSVRFLAQDRQLLCCCFDGGFDLWDFDRQEWVWHNKVQSQKAFCLAVTPDGRTIATGGEHEIRLWDTVSRELLATLKVNMWVSSLVFTPDGQTLVWGSGDGRVSFERAAVNTR